MSSSRRIRIVTAIAMVLGLFGPLAQPAGAAALSNTYIRLNRMATGTTTTMRLVFRTNGAGATSVVVNMNGADATTWTGSSGVVNTTQAVSVATCPGETGATALPGSITAAGSGSSITVSSVTALAATTTYCVDFTTASSVTTPTAGEYHPTVTAGSDSTTVAVRVISNDQVTITAVVPPTFNFVLSGNSDSFTTNLSTASTVSTTGVTVTITTNAPAGWIAWAKGTNQSSGSAGKGALKSTTASNYTIPTTNANALGSAAHTLSNGTEDYGLAVDSITDAGGGGTVTADAAYNSVASTKIGVLDTTIYRPIGSANGTANGDVLTLKERATIAGQTPAATDYTDIITLIGAGQF